MSKNFWCFASAPIFVAAVLNFGTAQAQTSAFDIQSASAKSRFEGNELGLVRLSSLDDHTIDQYYIDATSAWRSGNNVRIFSYVVFRTPLPSEVGVAAGSWAQLELNCETNSIQRVGMAFTDETGVVIYATPNLGRLETPTAGTINHGVLELGCGVAVFPEDVPLLDRVSAAVAEARAN
jgi:hypothetical protein